MTLIAEDLLLLLLDDGSGKPTVDSTKLPRVLAGAVVLELALNGSAHVAEDNETVKKGRIVVRTDPAQQDPVLADAVATIAGAKRPLTPKSAVEKLHKSLQDTLLSRLVEQGFIGEQRGKILGLFPTTSWPARDSAHEDAVRSRLHDVVVDGLEPDPRTAALIALLSAVDAVPKTFPDADKKQVRKRAKEIAEDNWASDAVRKAVQDIYTAVTVAVMVPVMAGGSGN